tara:strand:- start:1039 stop:1452 length:414 start_codon:yes stop_codon:yes gene_type:complete
LFGVNFADGRIKCYPLNDPRRGSAKKFYVRYVRGRADAVESARDAYPNLVSADGRRYRPEPMSFEEPPHRGTLKACTLHLCFNDLFAMLQIAKFLREDINVDCMRVLVIEDEAELCETIVETLREEGYAVDSSADGS